MHFSNISFLRYIPALVFVFAAHPVAAITVNNPLRFATFCGLINAVAAAIFWIALSLGIVVIVYAGFLFMTSEGSPAKIQQAKNALLYAIIGIVVGVTARGIVAVVYNFFGASLSSCR